MSTNIAASKADIQESQGNIVLKTLDTLSVNMCPKNSSEPKTDLSDCSIDEERQGTIGSFPMLDQNGQGYRHDFTAEGACDQLKAFSKKVEDGGVLVGDCDNKTRLIDRFAGGSFGELFIGEVIGKDKKVAVKVEPQVTGRANYLLKEGNVYRNMEGGPGIPKVHWYGFHGPDYGVLVMDLLGPTLETMFQHCNRTFSLKTILMLANQMIDILGFIHQNGHVHRDISPSNFVLGGEGNESKVYLIDFGHAKKYNSTFQLLPRRRGVNVPRAVVGTPRFISLHAHVGHEDSPRDDLESLGYVLLYLARGALPWQGLKADSMPEKLNKIAQVKMTLPVEKLCKGLPDEFHHFFNYIRTLQLYLPLDYEGIKLLFQDCAEKQNITLDKFDWEIEKDDTSFHEKKSSLPIVIPESLGASGESVTKTPPSR